jgi:hypothetical protein
MMSTPSETTIEDMRRFISRQVAGGFRSAADIKTEGVEVFAEGDNRSALRPISERLTEEAIHEQLAAQKEWPAVTDCDLLDRAFGELERAGIVARQNFSCCGNCGSIEILGEMSKAQGAGAKVRGYAFYHMQDTDSAAGGYGLLLNYGAAERDGESGVRIGNEIVDALQRHGLKTEWDGSWSKRIAVKLDWKRRFPE